MSTSVLEPTSPQEQLQARLADPKTVDALNRLLDRLDVVAAAVEMVDGFVHRAPEIVDNIADEVQTLRGSSGVAQATSVLSSLPALARGGVKVAPYADSAAFDRLLNSGLLEKLSDPETLQSLQALLEKLPLLAFSVQAIDGFLRRGDEIADSVAEGCQELRSVAPGFTIADLGHIAADLPQLLDAGRSLVASGLLERVNDLSAAGMALLEAGFFEPATVKTLAEMGQLATQSYTAAKQTPARTYGVFDLMRLLKDPQAQKAIHLLVEMTRQFGSRVH
jgi:hypothetical protein